MEGEWHGALREALGAAVSCGAQTHGAEDAWIASHLLNLFIGPTLLLGEAAIGYSRLGNSV